MDFDADLDARNLHCPLPILRAKKALANLESGQVLRVATTDPGALHDFQVFAQQTGNTLLQQQTEDATTTHWLQRR
ncbi:MAG: sulfurtransferase TusA family protein [Brachymonas sp.]|nr:sulfurtransferase TusA family protein [Brachymonas sp.]